MAAAAAAIAPVKLVGQLSERWQAEIRKIRRAEWARSRVPRPGLGNENNTLFTSDGLNAYFYALTAHFVHWVKGVGSRSKQHWQVAADLVYGQVIKKYRRRKLVRVKSVIRLGSESTIREALQVLGFSGRVNTAFIERVNLTIRRGVAALARRTWATALQSPHLEAHLRLPTNCATRLLKSSPPTA